MNPAKYGSWQTPCFSPSAVPVTQTMHTCFGVKFFPLVWDLL